MHSMLLHSNSHALTANVVSLSLSFAPPPKVYKALVHINCTWKSVTNYRVLCLWKSTTAQRRTRSGAGTALNFFSPDFGGPSVGPGGATQSHQPCISGSRSHSIDHSEISMDLGTILTQHSAAERSES